MVRATSIETYRQISESGLLSQRRLEVYKAICKCEPCTSGEAIKYMSEHGIQHSHIAQSRGRFTELRDLGVIKEVGVRACAVSGRKCIVWEVTGDLPQGDIHKTKIDKKLLYDFDLRGALSDFADVVNKAKEVGYKPTTLIKKLYIWLDNLERSR